MDKKLDKIEESLDDIKEKLSDISTTLAVNTASLQDHIKRTNLLEEKLEPLEEHVVQVRGFFKITIAGLGIIAAVLAILTQLEIL